MIITEMRKIGQLWSIVRLQVILSATARKKTEHEFEACAEMYKLYDLLTLFSSSHG